MGIFSKLFSATIKVACTPLTVIEDVSDAVSGEDPIATKQNLKSAANDIFTCLDDDQDDEDDW